MPSPSPDTFGQADDSFWLFGYGSLLWKPPPHFDQRVPGYIEGYVRRFWQASEDHRGTPSAPGRVLTLIDRAHWDTLTDHHEPPERVWGAAYHIPAAKVAEVREYLDIREINGYSIQFTPFHPAPFVTSISSLPTTPAHSSTRSITASTTIFAKPEKQGQAINCLVYIGLPSNPQFLGPQDPDALARHILKSQGPSGENREYLFLLEKCLLELSRDSGDKHVSDLVRRCKEIEAVAQTQAEGDEDGGDGAEQTQVPVGESLHIDGSSEQPEEVEK
ncbi:ChaC-like protein-domain-containing protein [Massariosphaeria phaeospora]|uniref:glutathione-specific gamma-glutamylcyclotransferase n=1 Tax=Massariosphaeria phaeospora TaxID=100035 RepID=A0A7C8MEI9_9PLEO|nr:ChaC-like protein-domain-containing protein [Massariosphaeria phaeospora]